MEPLIEKGADINATNGGNDSALILAIESGYLLKTLIISIQTKLHSFCCLGYEKTAELLIQKGADVGVINSRGTTALMNAANKGKIRCITCAHRRIHFLPLCPFFS